MKRLKIVLSVFFIAVSPDAFCQGDDKLAIPPFRQMPERTTEFPLKSTRQLYTDAEIATAKNNSLQHESAKSIRESIIKNADYWLDFTTDDLFVLMADARVPRGFDLCAAGCPVHGTQVFEKGRWPWLIDPRTPFQVTCPIGGEVYPSNDFKAFYNSDFTDKQALEGPYADDGFGWISPKGERFWFVAYANQWLWNRHIVPGMLNLSRAYLLTGDKRYADQAATMLYRLAVIYPSMDHENQSRYGLMQKALNNRYPGKILNRIWETSLITQASEAYDIVWKTIDTNKPLLERAGKDGRQLRAFIEANLLEDGIDGVRDEKIRGNFGMHQQALLYLHLARQHAGKDQVIHELVDKPSVNMATNGLRYALYNQVFRDGMPIESPEYNGLWVSKLTGIADVLNRTGETNLFAERRFKKILDAPLDIVAIGKYTPDWGDGGSTMGGLILRQPDVYQVAYNQYKDQRYPQWLSRSDTKPFPSYQSLFREKLPQVSPLPDDRAVAAQPSRLFAGYGLGILNNRSDKTAVAFTYGKHYAHYHWDFLNFELFANGQKMMPDLGYPDQMNAYVSSVYTWGTNTIPHNTVVIDAKRQDNNGVGVLHDFAEGGFSRVMDASSPAYTAASQYRRKLVMVDVSEDQSYVVDFFHVEGGSQHDYSLHGPPGEVITHQGVWSDTLRGTFAGEDVPLGEIYDNDVLRREGDKRGYTSYRGSGYQHLFHVQQLDQGKGLLEYRHIRDSAARLRIHLLSSDEKPVIYMADAYDKPVAKLHQLKYLIARRRTETGSPLRSTFLSILEPYQGNAPLIREARTTRPDSGEGNVVLVSRDGGTDVILSDSTGSTKYLEAYDIRSDARSVVATFDPSGKLTRVFFSDGTFFRCGSHHFTAAPVRGTVSEVHVENGSFRVNLEEKKRKGDENIAGRIAYFSNTHRTTVHPLSDGTFRGKQLRTTVKDDLLVGRARVNKMEGERLKVRGSLTFWEQYSGTTLLNNALKPIGIIKAAGPDWLQLANQVGAPAMPEDELWFSNIGNGDDFSIKAVFSWENGK